MSYEIEGWASFYRSTTRRARIAHRCSACGLQVAPGERYQEIRLAYEGRAETIKRCGRCETMYQHLRSLCDGFTGIDQALDCGLDYRDEWGKEPPEDVQAVIFATSDEASALLKIRP